MNFKAAHLLSPPETRRYRIAAPPWAPQQLTGAAARALYRFILNNIYCMIRAFLGYLIALIVSPVYMLHIIAIHKFLLSRCYQHEGRTPHIN